MRGTSVDAPVGDDTKVGNSRGFARDCGDEIKKPNSSIGAPSQAKMAGNARRMAFYANLSLVSERVVAAQTQNKWAAQIA